MPCLTLLIQMILPSRSKAFNPQANRGKIKETSQKVKRNQRLKGSHTKWKHNNIVLHKGHKKNHRPLEAKYPEAKAYALRLLSYRSRSKKEILERLKEKGFDTEETKRVIDFLEGAGFIKDEALAERLLRNAVERKCIGRRGIKMLLTKRGIEKELIDETLSALTDDMEQESAMRLVEKKLKTLKSYPEDSIRQKLWRMLERKEFSVDVINSVIKSVKL